MPTFVRLILYRLNRVAPGFQCKCALAVRHREKTFCGQWTGAVMVECFLSALSVLGNAYVKSAVLPGLRRYAHRTAELTTLLPIKGKPPVSGAAGDRVRTECLNCPA